MENRYQDIPQDNYEGCNYIGDFFESSLIQRTYRQLWNTQFPEKKLTSSRVFSIRDKDYIDFVREVFLEEELATCFLKILRNNVTRLQNINRFHYETKQIISFLLVWGDVQSRLITYPENISEIFKEKALQTLEDSSQSPIHTFENGEEIERYTGLNILLQNNINPIQDDGTIIYGIGTGDIEHGFFTVTDQSGQVYDIDVNGKKLDQIQINAKILKGLQGKLQTYEACLQHIKTANKNTPIPKDLRDIIQKIIDKENPSRENIHELIIEKLTKKIKKLKSKISKINDAQFVDFAAQLGNVSLPFSPYMH